MSQYFRIPDFDGDQTTNPNYAARSKKKRSRTFYFCSFLAAIFVILCLALSLPLGPSLSDLIKFAGAGGASSNHWSGWKTIDKMFVFGDSYSATGFDANGEQPSLHKPMGNTDRWDTDWKVRINNFRATPSWTELLTRTYNVSILKTYNFATPGASFNFDQYNLTGTIYENVTFESFGSELQNMFKPIYTADSARPRGWEADTTLFVIFFGINDYELSWMENFSTIKKTGVFPGSLLDALVATFKHWTEELYSIGARNFLILNVPPYRRNSSSRKKLKIMTAAAERHIPQFNKRLEAMRNDFIKKSPDMTMYLFDTYTLYSKIIDNPGSFEETKRIKTTSAFCEYYANGTEVFDAYDKRCDGEVGDYFWQNGMHPTYTVQNATAAAIAKYCWGKAKPYGLCA